ncbi:hypothetical protein PAMA_017964 [Pampus argenteus]
MISSDHQSLLKIKDGRFVTVRRSQAELKLCAIDIQNGAHIASRVLIKSKGTQMAFCFKFKKHYYLPMVEGGTLKLQQSKNERLIDESEHYWFQKENLGSSEHYGLRSVVEPSLYLCGPDNKTFFLSSNNQKCALVTEEEIPEDPTRRRTRKLK